jgi:L-ascorbate metabolism protein UlaG (beta-lactamase superfamily)
MPSTTAEGIETGASVVWLSEQGCSFGQGYLFGRAMPKSEIDVVLGVVGRRRTLPANAVVQVRMGSASRRDVALPAHRDHNTASNTDANLAAFCQGCHMIHDRPEHQRRRWRTLFRRKASGDLDLPPILRTRG